MRVAPGSPSSSSDTNSDGLGTPGAASDTSNSQQPSARQEVPAHLRLSLLRNHRRQEITAQSSAKEKRRAVKAIAAEYKQLQLASISGADSAAIAASRDQRIEALRATQTRLEDIVATGLTDQAPRFSLSRSTKNSLAIAGGVASKVGQIVTGTAVAGGCAAAVAVVTPFALFEGGVLVVAGAIAGGNPRAEDEADREMMTVGVRDMVYPYRKAVKFLGSIYLRKKLGRLNAYPKASAYAARPRLPTATIAADIANQLEARNQELSTQQESGVTGNALTPLHLAAMQGESDTVDAILTEGADVNALSSDKCSALHLAANAEMPDTDKAKIVRKLLDAHARTELVSHGYTALHLAAIKSDQETVKALVEGGASVHARAANGCTALYIAAEKRDVDMVRFLVNNGADPNMAADDGTTPLVAAAENYGSEAAAALIANGADLHATIRNGDTVLHVAARSDNMELMRVLLASNVDIKAENHAGETPFELAWKLRNLQSAEMLRDHEPPPLSRAQKLRSAIKRYFS